MTILIAEAYLRPPRSVSFTTTPGSHVAFHGGYARITDERDIMHLLRREDVVLRPDERYQSHLTDWIAACGETPPARCTLDVLDHLIPASDWDAGTLDVLRELHTAPPPVEEIAPPLVGWFVPVSVTEEDMTPARARDERGHFIKGG